MGLLTALVLLLVGAFALLLTVAVAFAWVALRPAREAFDPTRLAPAETRLDSRLGG